MANSNDPQLCLIPDLYRGVCIGLSSDTPAKYLETTVSPEEACAIARKIRLFAGVSDPAIGATGIEWHPFPETAPACDYGKEFLVTTRTKLTGLCEVSVDFYNVDSPVGPYFDNDCEEYPVIAWAELPEPFAGETPKFVLWADTPGDHPITVFGKSLAECKKQALAELTVRGDNAKNEPISLRKDYSGKLVSTWNPKTNHWEDE